MILDIIGAITPKRVWQGLLLVLFVMMIVNYQRAIEIVTWIFGRVAHIRVSGMMSLAQSLLDPSNFDPLVHPN